MIKFIILALLSLNIYASHVKYLDMIGDSIISSREGDSIRYELNKKGFNYNFNGSFIDSYGFHHDAFPGYTTWITINRLNYIPKSDTYFILLGINDVNIKGNSPLQTFNNLIYIAEALTKKNSEARIYISTLLPVNGKENDYSEKVNELLRNKLNCFNCELIDLGLHFKSQSNWQELFIDGIHPNKEGNAIIIEYLFDNLI